MQSYKLFVDGQWLDTEEKAEVIDKYSGQAFAQIAQASESHVAKAVEAAKISFQKNKLTPTERYEILVKTGALLMENVDKIGEAISREVGKPLGEGKAEVMWTAGLFQDAAEEAKRITGQMVPIDAAQGSENRLAFTVRMPVGVVCAITPFNYPLNLAAHKIASALAAGNTVVFKPTQQTPVSGVMLVELLLEAGLPAGHINLLLGSGSTVGEWLLENRDINFYSFTGSAAVGEKIRNKIGLRKCTLELGSNSAVIVHNDADIAQAAQQCAFGSFSNAGQVCISVQRIYVHQEIYQEFLEQIKSCAEKLVVGDPMDDQTDLGPMISTKETDRIEQWINEAVENGATIVTGGKRLGERMFEPTILTDVKKTMKVVYEETFAPVVVVISYEKIEEAVEATNDSQFGLQAGIFTKNFSLGIQAALGIETGGVIIGDTCSYRVGHMPYGGVKRSGSGKEGPKYAIEELTEEKLIVFNV